MALHSSKELAFLCTYLLCFWTQICSFSLLCETALKSFSEKTQARNKRTPSARRTSTRTPPLHSFPPPTCSDTLNIESTATKNPLQLLLSWKQGRQPSPPTNTGILSIQKRHFETLKGWRRSDCLSLNLSFVHV